MHYSGSTNCIKSSLMAAVSHALSLACQEVLVNILQFCRIIIIMVHLYTTYPMAISALQ